MTFEVLMVKTCTNISEEEDNSYISTLFSSCFFLTEDKAMCACYKTQNWQDCLFFWSSNFLFLGL